MTSKSPARSCDDVDESVLSYAEIKALCAGNPLIREKMDLDVQVSKLKMARSEHQHNVYELQDKLKKHFPAWIRHTEKNIKALRQDEALAAETRAAGGNDEKTEKKFPGMTLMEKEYSDKKEAGETLTKLCAAAGSSPLPLGTYRGFEMSVKRYEHLDEVELTLKGKVAHTVNLGNSGDGNILRMDNSLDNITERVADQEERLDELRSQVRAAQEEADKPFPMEAELEQKSDRLNELNISLSLDEKSLNSGGILSDSVANDSDDIAADGVADDGLEPDEREALIGNAKQKLGFNSIVTDAQRGRDYSGDVLEVGEEYAVQKISRGVGIIHSFGKAPALPGAIAEHGMKDISICYDKGGKCSVAPKENEQARQAETVASY
jgi:hypothetical protein